jgi:hypothetical protein
MLVTYKYQDKNIKLDAEKKYISITNYYNKSIKIETPYYKL